jgi:hypothetical protein
VRKTCCIVILCFFYTGAAAQSVAVINGSPVSQKEFVWVYQKHRPGNAEITLTQLISFLNIYIDFKLKVLDARASGMDKDSTYQAEVKSYEQSFHAAANPGIHRTDYELIMNEYKEALLLFNISEKKIWDVMNNSEEEIHGYYNTHAAVYGSKPYLEVQGDVAADYQRELECSWVTSLRNKYVITMDQNTLVKLVR